MSRIETDAFTDALQRILDNKPGTKLTDEDIIQCLAFVVGGIASIEKRLKALEERDPIVWQ